MVTSINTTTDIENGILIFPNPMINEVNFKFSKKENAEREIRLFSLDGKLITKKLGNSPITINTELLPRGMYFYQIIEDGKTVDTNKLIKE